MKSYPYPIRPTRNLFRFLTSIFWGGACSLWLMLLPAPVHAQAAPEFFVAPNGSPAGNGTRDNPWNITTAISGSATSQIPPGSTVWLRGGKYRGPFNSRLKGTAQKPVILRQYPGERATIEGKFNVYGDYGWYWGFEITGFDTDRTQIAGCKHKLNLQTNDQCAVHTVSWTPRGLIPSGLQVSVDESNGHIPVGNKLINLVVHDGNDNGVSIWSTSKDNELYGSLSYYNGWIGMDRAHGHSIYTQNFNDSPTNRFEDNFLFNTMFYGAQMYGGADFANNYRLEGNVFFNNGAFGGEAQPSVFVGGGGAADNIEFVNNFWNSGAVILGLQWARTLGNNNVTLTNNLMFGGIEFTRWNSIRATGNTFVSNPVYIDPDAGARIDMSQNTRLSSRPTQGTQIFVRPNRYEAKRANIIIYNWESKPAVDVDVSRVLVPGDQYEVRDVQNFFGPAVASGTYSGAPLRIPMVGLSTAVPFGFELPDNERLRHPVHTGPVFGTFILMSGNGSAPPGAFDFSLGSANQKISVTQGSTASNRIDASLVSGSPASVSFSVSGLPQGASVSYGSNGSSCTVSCGVDVRLAAGAATPAGTHTVTVTASGNGVSRSVTFGMEVMPAAVFVAPPVFSAQGGTYSQVQHIAMVSSTSGASIYYTLDGSTPTRSSALYNNNPVLIDRSLTLKAIAVKSGMTDSAVASASYVINLPPPPAGNTLQAVYRGVTGEDKVGQGNQTFGNGRADFHISLSGLKAVPVKVTITSNTDGVWETPYNNYHWIIGTQYNGTSAELWFEQYNAQTFRVKVVYADGTSASAEAVAPPNPAVVAAPVMNPGGGTYTQATPVSLGSATSEASIYYTLDGSTPTRSSALYNNNPVLIDRSLTLKAIAVKSGMTDSAVTSASYVINLPPPPAGNTLQAVYRGVTGEDKVGQGNQTFGNGRADFHISLSGLKAVPVKVTITSNTDGVWETPYNNYHWIIGTQYNGTSAELWFEQYNAQTFRVKVVYADGTSATADAVAASASASTSAVLPSGYYELENASVAAPAVVANDPGASGGKYVAWNSANSGSVNVSITVNTPGTYYIWARVLAPNSNADSVNVSMDGGPQDIYDMAENRWSNQWQWTKVNGRNGQAPLTLNPRAFQLGAGSHTVRLTGREANAKVDKIFVTGDINAVPQ